ncbi:rho GTPase activating protein at 100F [Rhipicephalus microplus]|uniref:rho GTPase activating protein at 100F n=1 Tax=Rhipicephalus microplus TaxID=6941 RepID=UPI003F6A86DA
MNHPPGRPPPRLGEKVKHIIAARMLCCGRKKENHEGDLVVCVEGGSETWGPRVGAVRPRLAPGAPAPEMVLQGDFRKVSGISSEVFRQIEAVEREYDATTAAHLEAVQKRGEMVVRVLDPRCLGRAGAQAARRYAQGGTAFVEIVKRPGQTLGLYIREGDGVRTQEGVFISRIALESAVYHSGLLRVGDEILAVNLVDVRNMSLDDVVIIMSIPRRLVLAVRSKGAGGPGGRSGALPPVPPMAAERQRPPVVIVKRGVQEAEDDLQSENGMGGGLMENPYYSSTVPVRRQPQPPHRYPKTLESLAEQVHAFRDSPHMERSSVARNRYWDEHDRGMSTRRLLRTESEQRLMQPEMMQGPHGGRYYSLRPSATGGGMVSLHHAAQHHHQQQQQMAPGGILRRRSLMESCSDTEVQSGRRPPSAMGAPFMVAPTHGQHPRTLTGRSNSLPRGVALGVLDPRRALRHGVRFERATYDSQEDSDGALSAPELPSGRPRRPKASGRQGKLPGVFSSSEYRAWMRRAPSTSALYERVGRLSSTASSTGLSARAMVHPQLSSSSSATSSLRRPLPRVAHSAESLLDSLRQEQQQLQLQQRRSSLLSGLPTWGSSSLDLGSSGSSLRPMGRSSSLLFPRPLRLPHAMSLDYVRAEDRALCLNPREFLKYRPEKESESVLAGAFSGLLWLHLLGARGLRGHGPRDLYCVIETDRAHKARTVVRSGDHSFDWDEVFELDLVDNTTVSFLLYSWDPQSRHKLCYKGTVHLLSALREAPAHSLALRLEPRGALYLKMRYRDPRHTFQRTPNYSGGGVFGAPLDALVAREKGTVPLIVQRCVQQVENRGLDIVGIYRLCGSAVRKRMLREAIERSCAASGPHWKVDLSAEHVPDINVVTSLLKDYLRELPEPLFTKGLFDMLVDGLSVCLPDDPDGNAKLMFSILDCLPKVNRCTALFLLDHLKLVSSRSDRNKMTSRALAECFGPVCVCHAETGFPVSDLRRPIEVFAYLLDIWPLNRAAFVAASGSDLRPSLGASIAAGSGLGGGSSLGGSTYLTSSVSSSPHKGGSLSGGAPSGLYSTAGIYTSGVHTAGGTSSYTSRTSELAGGGGFTSSTLGSSNTYSSSGGIGISVPITTVPGLSSLGASDKLTTTVTAPSSSSPPRDVTAITTTASSTLTRERPEPRERSEHRDRSEYRERSEHREHNDLRERAEHRERPEPRERSILGDVSGTLERERVSGHHLLNSTRDRVCDATGGANPSVGRAAAFGGTNGIGTSSGIGVNGAGGNAGVNGTNGGVGPSISSMVTQGSESRPGEAAAAPDTKPWPSQRSSLPESAC